MTSFYAARPLLVFNRLFFPSFDPLAGTLAAFATYTVGFVARPFGGVIIGHWGDRVGRKSMLVLTLVIMGVATFGIGLLPTYAQIGPWAAVALVVLRVIQGFGVGGEWGGAVLMAVEHAPAHRRGFYGSWPQMGVPAGLLTSTAVFAWFARLPEEQFLSWGWRVPFLVSILLVAVGLIIRLRILETPAFSKVKASQTVAARPIVELLRTQWKEVLLAVGARFAENGAYYIYTVSFSSMRHRKWDRQACRAERRAHRCRMRHGGDPLRRIVRSSGPSPVYLFGACFTTLFAHPLLAPDTGSTSLVWLAIVGALTFSHAAMYGPQASFFSELFGTRVRYSGASLGSQLSSVLAGGLSPFIATALLPYGRGALAAYIIGMALITIVAVSLAKETRHHSID